MASLADCYGVVVWLLPVLY